MKKKIIKIQLNLDELQAKMFQEILIITGKSYEEQVEVLDKAIKERKSKFQLVNPDTDENKKLNEEISNLEAYIGKLSFQLSLLTSIHQTIENKTNNKIISLYE